MLNLTDVDRALSPNDEMFSGDEKHYFGVGQDAIELIERALRSAKKEPSEIQKILDFPCGHGRVLRYIRTAFPQAEITAADLNRDCVDFCAAHFGAIPFYSSNDVAQITLPRDYFDIIWVGSLFTHFDAPNWHTFLTLFCSLLKPDGLLLFTTHGRWSYELITTKQNYYCLDRRKGIEICQKYASVGFGYADYANSQDYGISLSDPAWVCQLLTNIPGFRLVGASEKIWDNHHDVYACVRDVTWNAPCTQRNAWGHFLNLYFLRLKAIIKGIIKSGLKKTLPQPLFLKLLSYIRNKRV